MPAKLKFDVVAVIGKYTDAGGNEKSRYLRIGAVLEGERGMSLKLDSVPVGWDGYAYLNEPRDKPQERAQAPRSRRAEQDDVPFVFNTSSVLVAKLVARSTSRERARYGKENVQAMRQIQDDFGVL